MRHIFNRSHAHTKSISTNNNNYGQIIMIAQEIDSIYPHLLQKSIDSIEIEQCQIHSYSVTPLYREKKMIRWSTYYLYRIQLNDNKNNK